MWLAASTHGACTRAHSSSAVAGDSRTHEGHDHDPSYRHHQHAFNWDMLDVSHPQCGESKCFYPAPALGTGYLVSADVERRSRWERAWELVRRHEGMRSIALGPPQELTISSSAAARLNNNLTWEIPGSTIRSRFSANSSVLLQRVQDCLQPRCVLMGCIPKKHAFFSRSLAGFLGSMTPLQRSSLVCTLAAEFNATLDLLRDEPCLLPDFQAFLDIDGHVLHLDVDRCWEPPLRIGINPTQCFSEILHAIEGHGRDAF
jgi:hypothetical protein